MAEEKFNSFPLETCITLDRNDIYSHDICLYPETYSKFKESIENTFFKSELLLKCKIEFERLIKIEIPEQKQNSEINVDDLSLNLVFTGAIKSGRSSIINMLLNTKAMPINVLGSTCCVKISHPKSKTRQITVGIEDWEGWELEGMSVVDIDELPSKVEEIQAKLLKNSLEKEHKLTKRLHIQIPHWFLKNITIYKCSPIDGIYSFDEPFDLIDKTKNPILMHVIEASNGLMEWDRTFLSKIQYRFPQLPIFFIINHIDIQYDILIRDRCPRFENTPDRTKSDYFESESDQTSADETISEKFPLNELGIIRQQNKLIENSKKQIMKLGFALEKGLTIYYSSISVKEFFKLIKIPKVENETDYHWNFISEFFLKLNKYLDAWLEKMLITSSLQLKCQINGVVDAILCHIKYPSILSQDVTSDIYIQNIKKTEKSITETFNFVISDLEKQVLKIVKDRLKNSEGQILNSIPVLSSEDPAEIIHIIKPILIKNCENILIGKPGCFNINEEIHGIILKEIDQLQTVFSKIYKSRIVINFTKYIFNLFLVLKKTYNYPLLINLPEEIFYGNTKWYKDILRVATRRIRGTSCRPRELIQEMIDDMTIIPLIKTALMGFRNILENFQFFTKKYQETYKKARSWTINIKEVFRKLVMVDFIIQVIEKSFQETQSYSDKNELHLLNSFYSEFYERNNEKRFIYKKINIQSFTCLFDSINNLCSKRILPPNTYILSYKSTQFLRDGMCLISFSRMDCDLFKAIKNKTKWTIKNICSIITDLKNAVEYLLPHYSYIQVELLPENIFLNRTRSGYTCCFHPNTQLNNTIGFNVFSHCNERYKKTVSVIFQLGLVLSWIITNDIHVCSEIFLNPENPQLDVIINQKIVENMPDDLKFYNLNDTCIKLLFRGNEFESLDAVSQEISKHQAEPSKVIELFDDLNKLI